MQFTEKTLSALDAEIGIAWQQLKSASSKNYIRLFVLFKVGCLLALASLTIDFAALREWQQALVSFVGSGFVLAVAHELYKCLSLYKQRADFLNLIDAFNALESTHEIELYKAFNDSCSNIAPTHHLLFLTACKLAPFATQGMHLLQHNQQLELLKGKFDELTRKVQLEGFRREYGHPLNKVQRQLKSALRKLTGRRAELLKQWQNTYQGMSWWNKLKYCDGPDFKVIDAEIAKLEKLNRQFKDKHGQDLAKLKQHAQHVSDRSIMRLNQAYEQTRRYQETLFQQQSSLSIESPDRLLMFAGWSAMLGVSLSAMDQLSVSHSVYDALRGVNGNYESMSDAEIWWDTLWMSGDSLAGLVSLTKGAYFEQLVAAQSGGELFEHFNHADTDIVIDGVAYQLKATMSTGYVDSVDEGIPVIASSEVAALTGAIDSGISDAEISAEVAIALDGSAVDVSDAFADGILAGVGGLGVFATLKGLEHAADKYNNGGDGEQAIFEGIEIALVGSAKAIVDTGELVYKAAMSRPSRFVGRSLVKGLKKLDSKLTEQSKTTTG